MKFDGNQEKYVQVGDKFWVKNKNEISKFLNKKYGAFSNFKIKNLELTDGAEKIRIEFHNSEVYMISKATFRKWISRSWVTRISGRVIIHYL